MRKMLKLNVVFMIASLLLVGQTLAYEDIDEYHELIESLANNETFVNDFEQNIKDLLELEPNYFDYSPFEDPKMLNFTFKCKKSDEPHVPRNVHELRPEDISVVAALGDSLTASLGSRARTVLGLLIENRGRSWSIGGDKTLEKVITLPNILKKFNPNVAGFTTGSDIVFLTKKGKGLNVAVSGAEANDMPQQARELVDRLKASKTVNFEKDWKMITLFIGGNDLCRFCKKDDPKHTPQGYIDEIQRALDTIYQEVPRAFVNLVSVLNVEEVKLLNKGLACKVLHKIGCRCAAYPSSDSAERQLVDYTKTYQSLVEDLVNTKKRYDGRDDFTVVVQPFMKDMRIPLTSKGKVDLTYFAPDCFHLSTKGHTSAAIGLWNNLFQPIGSKETTWSIGENMQCPPADHPFFYTNKN